MSPKAADPSLLPDDATADDDPIPQTAPDSPAATKPRRGRPPGAKTGKRKRKAVSRSGPGPTERKRNRTAALEEALTDTFTQLGAGVSMVAPVTGLVFVDRAPKRAQALVKIAANNPALLQALERFTQGSSVFDLIVDGVALGVAASIDMGRTDPASPVARIVGENVLDALGGDDGPSDDASQDREGFLAGATATTPF